MIRTKPFAHSSFRSETSGSRTGFGRRGGLPLLLLNYFAANMDAWDPKVTNGLVAERDVILFNNAGVGSSTGETASTVAAMTKHCVDFCRALDLRNIDVVGSRSAA
jgi:pimeloyl-ACP methyl ester carboxylesterase